MQDLIPYRDKYKDLLSYKKAECIYDITFAFCKRYIAHGDRTYDQMVQAARSGKQNIAEGCSASATSSGTEIKLLGIAKASLHELLVDYEDYLRVRGLRQWPTASKEVMAMRRLGREHSDSEFYRTFIESRNDEVIANMAIVLIRQACELLRRQLKSAADRFTEEGGFREKMFRARLESRKK